MMLPMHEHAPERPVPATPSVGLSAADERRLVKLFQQGRTAQSRLTHEESLTKTERQSLQQVATAGVQARNDLITAHLGLVHDVARHYQGLGVPHEDLIQEGTVGLIQAITRYARHRRRRRSRLAAAAMPVIAKAMTQAIADQGYPVRVPVAMQEQLQHFRQQQVVLTQQLRRAPTRGELARALQISLPWTDLLAFWSRTPLSFDAVAQVAATGSVSTWPDLVQTALVEQMVATLRQRRQRRVLRLAYGLHGKDRLSLYEISQLLKVSSRRVRQVQRTAETQLRRQYTQMPQAS